MKQILLGWKWKIHSVLLAVFYTSAVLWSIGFSGELQAQILTYYYTGQPLKPDLPFTDFFGNPISVDANGNSVCPLNVGNVTGVFYYDTVTQQVTDFTLSVYGVSTITWADGTPDGEGYFNPNTHGWYLSGTPDYGTSTVSANNTTSSFRTTNSYPSLYGTQGLAYCNYSSNVAGTLSVPYTPATTKNLGTNCKQCNKPNAPAYSEGDPINPATGNMFETETDFIGAANTGIELQRYYNSQDTTATAFGANWHSTWYRSVSQPSSTTVSITNADGRVDTFTKNSAGAWVPNPDVTNVLSAVMSGKTQTGWKLVTEDDSTELYTLDGRLSTVTNRAGNVTTLAYDSNKRLITVTGPFGHTLTFSYNTNNLVATVNLPDGGILSYGYDANNNLTSVTYPDNTVRQYVYNEQTNTSNTSLPHALTGIIDESGNRYATWQYDTYGRAISSQHAGGEELTTLAYNADGSTTVTDARGNVHSYTLTTQFGLVKPTAVTGVPILNTGGQAFTYDSNGFIASRTDWNGNITTYTHDTRGDETSRTEASGTALARTITTVWHPTFHLPTQITAPSGVSGVNRVTTFSYDTTHGNLLKKRLRRANSAALGITPTIRLDRY